MSKGAEQSKEGTEDDKPPSPSGDLWGWLFVPYGWRKVWVGGVLDIWEIWVSNACKFGKRAHGIRGVGLSDRGAKLRERAAPVIVS